MAGCPYHYGCRGECMQNMAAQQQMGMKQYYDHYLRQQMMGMQQQAAKLDILAGSVSVSEVKKKPNKLLLLLR